MPDRALPPPALLTCWEGTHLHCARHASCACACVVSATLAGVRPGDLPRARRHAVVLQLGRTPLLALVEHDPAGHTWYRLLLGQAAN